MAYDDPLAEVSESHEIAIVAARALSASRRTLNGEPFDETDVRSLEMVADLLDSSGSIVEYFSSNGERGQAPAQAVAPCFDVAIDALIELRPALEHSLEDALRDVAQIIRGFIKQPMFEVAKELARFFALLGRSAASRVAVPGETVLAL